MNQDITIAANGTVAQMILGGNYQYFRVRKTTVPFQMSWDGATFFDGQQNDDFGPQKQSRIYFRCKNGQAATATILYDQNPFGGQDTTSSDVTSYAYGNGGLSYYQVAAVAQKIGGGVFDITSNVQVDLTVAGAIVIPGARNGQKRKQITFMNMGAVDALIFDANGGFFFYCAANNVPYTFQTDSTFYVYGKAAQATKFYYSELYYGTY
jgi:hypothetical protein